MVYDDIEIPSRWVSRALWLIAAALALAVLAIRSHGIGSAVSAPMEARTPNAAAAFRVPAENSASMHSLDTLSWADHPAVRIEPGQPAAVAAGATITINGWAFDRQANAPFAAIGARVDDRPDIFSAAMQVSRPDVATALGSPQAAEAGFVLAVETAHLSVGPHSIAIRALRSDGRSAVVLDDAVRFDVRPNAAAMQRTDLIEAINGVGVNAVASLTSPVMVQRSYRKITVSGWGFVTKGQRLARSATMMVDGNPVASAIYGLARPDVATTYHDIRLSRCGFAGTLSTDSLTPGIHEIKVQLVSGDGSSIESSSAMRVNLQ